ncbi:GntR family transcriptional regulator [Melghirimyces profundicolus]|uniref:GntR family transcriptional regulator n=1 Tax=Melghirimyces profundicolus TaxID=1242148 RepID=A0A2T6C8N2_9BACL|nr:GntR family transcriptional regulator [Melghirimyces profundicolus]PTX64670.1 GntR family transcriptional regulator [Melghirimyces profundicolus]
MNEGWNFSELNPIRDKVYHYIKNAILKGELTAGERIIERDLAEKLSISRTPIREALFRLESQGFVKTLPRKGVVVARLSPDEIIEIFTILSALSALAAKLAARKIDEKTQLELDRLTGNIERILAGEDIGKDVSLFHIDIVDTICQAAKSPKLLNMLHSLFDYIHAFARTGFRQPDRMRRSLEEHRDIAIAVRDGEAELAENLTKIHIENSKKAYLKALKGDNNGEEKV